MHFMIEAPGFERLITHVFRDGDRYLDSDAVFGVRSSLITHWEEYPPDPTPDGKDSVENFYVLKFDFVLNSVNGSEESGH